jgi:hypothetical protein
MTCSNGETHRRTEVRGLGQDLLHDETDRRGQGLGHDLVQDETDRLTEGRWKCPIHSETNRQTDRLGGEGLEHDLHNGETSRQTIRVRWVRDETFSTKVRQKYWQTGQ